ncbi:MAG: hypothetical protein ACOYT4_03490 [Nanoarchaeota archaeon]
MRIFIYNLSKEEVNFRKIYLRKNWGIQNSKYCSLLDLMKSTEYDLLSLDDYKKEQFKQYLPIKLSGEVLNAVYTAIPNFEFLEQKIMRYREQSKFRDLYNAIRSGLSVHEFILYERGEINERIRSKLHQIKLDSLIQPVCSHRLYKGGKSTFSQFSQNNGHSTKY